MQTERVNFGRWFWRFVIGTIYMTDTLLRRMTMRMPCVAAAAEGSRDHNQPEDNREQKAKRTNFFVLIVARHFKNPSQAAEKAGGASLPRPRSVIGSPELLLCA